jgi:TRAP-type C4-dicarboxylate transport system substrate-binding protein
LQDNQIKEIKKEIKSMKKFILFLLALILILGLGCKKEEKQIVMKLGHYGNEIHTSQEAAKMFAAAVEERTNGRIKILIYPNNQLGAPPDFLEQNIVGAIDMSLPGQDQLAHYFKKMACADKENIETFLKMCEDEL